MKVPGKSCSDLGSSACSQRPSCKERARKSTRDTELARLDKLFRRNRREVPQFAVEEGARAAVDGVRKAGYGRAAFDAVYAALAAERRALCPEYRLVAARIAELWDELKVRPTHPNIPFLCNLRSSSPKALT